MDLEVPSKGVEVGLAAGESVGPWRIEGQLGRGGMSTVYAVIHAEIGKRAALKVVHRHVLSSEFPPARVILEAQVVNRIAHRNIVDIFENGELPDGRPFLVMERLDGRSLDQQLAFGRLSTDEVIGILLQICAALGAAHAAGIIHCDLKPGNVFLIHEESGSGRRVKVLDWGIARVITPRPRLERPGLALGTPRYISPEQVQGREPSPASDIYSLGVMAYELFLEEQLFLADSTTETLKLHLRGEPPSPEEMWPGIPPALTGLLLAMLAKAPADRPTATEVADELTAIRDELRQYHTAMEQSETVELAAGTAASAFQATGGEQTPVPMSIFAAAAELQRSEPRRRQYARVARRSFTGIELIAAVGAIALIAGVGAMLGYRTAGAVTESTQSMPAVMPSVAGSVAGSVADSMAGSGPPSIAIEAMNEIELDERDAEPPRSWTRAARSPAAVGGPDAPQLRKPGGDRRAGDPAARRPGAASTGRRGTALALDPNGTIEPY